MYSQANPNAGAQGFDPSQQAQGQAPGADGVYEADYREVDNDNN